MEQRERASDVLFKAGDVVTVRADLSYRNANGMGFQTYWNEKMDIYAGKTFEIENSSRSGRGAIVYKLRGVERWSFDQEWLFLAEAELEAEEDIKESEFLKLFK